MKLDDITSLVRENVQSLKPYRSARDDFQEGILLDANENSFGAPFDEAAGLNRYPDPYQKKLRTLISNYRSVAVDHVFTGVGSDEAIDLLIRVFCEPGSDHIITTPPTYGMYNVAASVNNVEVREVLLTDEFQPDVSAILEQANARSKILFLCSPNNPTGNVMEQESVKILLKEFAGIIVVDEAYIDFAEQDSLSRWVEKYPNLVVTQTLSKAFGLAGIRLGIAIADPKIIGYLMKIKAPYNVNTLTSTMACKAFDNIGQVQKNIAAIIEERGKLEQHLRAMPGIKKIYPSDANFLLFRVAGARKVYRQLAEKGVIIRYRGDEPRCDECLRVTVGTPEQNIRFINALNEIHS